MLNKKNKNFICISMTCLMTLAGTSALKINKVFAEVTDTGNSVVSEAKASQDKVQSSKDEEIDTVLNNKPVTEGKDGYHTKADMLDVRETMDMTTDHMEQINKLIEGISPSLEQSTHTDGWKVFDLIKAGKKIPENYLADMENNIKTNSNYLNLNTGMDDVAKCESIALSVLTAGGNPTNFGGVNLIERMYNSKTLAQEIPGKGNEENYAYALIVLDAGKFDIPSDAQWTRENLIKALLDKQKSDGGWSKSMYPPNTSLTYSTGIVISALAPYYNTNTDVKTSLDKAITFLSESRQYSDGGFGAFNNTSNAGSNLAATVIIGLCAMGIDPTTDSRFVKNGKNSLDALMNFALSDNSGFGNTSSTSANPQSTEISFRAISAYKLFKEGKGSIYNVKTTTQVIKVTGISLNKQNASLKEEEIVDLKATITPENATNKNVNWTSNNEVVAKVDANGKVTALKAGTAIITAASADNKDAKAECVVTVTATAQDEHKLIQITNQTSDAVVKLGNDAEVSVKAVNSSNKAQDAVLIVTLYDESSKEAIKYTCGKNAIKEGEYSVLIAKMNIPSSGVYTLKAFVCDSLETMKPISNIIDIPIK